MNSVANASRLRQSTRAMTTRRNARSITGQFNSIRPTDDLHRAFQSWPEFLHLAILDVHSNVEFFSTQPETFELAGNRAYTPDALIVFRRDRRPVFREVKPRRLLEIDTNKFWERVPAIVEQCEARGADFEIVTEGYWLDPVRWSISSHLRHAVRRAKRWEMDAVLALLEDGAASIAEIMRHPVLGAEGKFAALALCSLGLAELRRDKTIDYSTVIRLTNRGN